MFEVARLCIWQLVAPSHGIWFGLQPTVWLNHHYPIKPCRTDGRRPVSTSVERTWRRGGCLRHTLPYLAQGSPVISDDSDPSSDHFILSRCTSTGLMLAASIDMALPFYLQSSTMKSSNPVIFIGTSLAVPLPEPVASPISVHAYDKAVRILCARASFHCL